MSALEARTFRVLVGFLVWVWFDSGFGVDSNLVSEWS